MKNRITAMALVLAFCLLLLPAPVLAAGVDLDFSRPPRITELQIVSEAGVSWIRIKIRTHNSVRELMDMLTIFEKEHYLSGICLSYSLEGGAWTEGELTVDGNGDPWGGYWRTEPINGLSSDSWVQVRARYTGVDDDGNPVLSDWSEAKSLNEPSNEPIEDPPAEEAPFEFNAHDWAKAELAEADGAGLIPADLREKDLKEPITRAEFAAVSVKVYEALSGIKAEPAAENPFTDTADVEVLKALNVGVTNGTSATEFSPDALLNREQAATMLSRVYKKVAFEGWTLDTDGDYAEAFRALFTMPEPFADDADISPWARDSVYFMAANGVLNGVGNNRFAPKLVTSGEETLNHATREQAILIAIRLVRNLSA